MDVQAVHPQPTHPAQNLSPTSVGSSTGVEAGVAVAVGAG